MHAKRRLLLVCAAGLLFVLCALGVLYSKRADTETLVLPFSPEEVTAVELYCFTVPTAAEQKLVTAKDEIGQIIETLTTVAVRENTLDRAAGGTVISFRFQLADGTDFELIYVSHGVKSGELKSAPLFHYQTSADIGAIWTHYGDAPRPVEASALPADQA